MQEHEPQEEFSLKNYFVPVTTSKAINWIILIGLIVYANMLFNGFVWDDLTYVLYNSQVHTFNISTLIGSSLFNSAGQYRPLPALYFTLMYMLFHQTTFYYHLVQLLLHITDAILVFILFIRFFSKKLSLLIALIFLVNPIQVESVSYIGSIASELFFVFGIIALLICNKKTVSYKRIICIFLLLLLSLLSKETGILFLPVIFLYRFLFIKDKSKIFIVYGLVTLIIYAFLRVIVGKIYLSTMLVIPIAQLSLPARALSIPAIMFYYLKTFFYPMKLAVDQLWVVNTMSFTAFYIPLVLDFAFLLFCSLLGIDTYHNNPKNFSVFIFFSTWFALGLLLLIQIFPLDLTVSDRWFYFPIVGLLGIVAIGIQAIINKYKHVQTLIYVFLIAIILVFSMRSIVRNMDWVNGLNLFLHDSTVTDNYNIENTIGTEYGFAGNYPAALLHDQKSVALHASDSNLYNLGFMYQVLGKANKAKQYYYEAYNFPDSEPSHNHIAGIYENLGYILYAQGNMLEAQKIIQNGISDYPKDGTLWEILALCDYKLGQQKNSINAAKKAEILLSSEESRNIYNQIVNKTPIKVTK
jgi:tetratricopeptide (TPR) repeat protein